MAKDRIEEEKTQTEQAEELPKAKETVLLVDDEAMLLDVGRQMLEAMGYDVITASTGEEAVEIYGQNKDQIDMVLLDMAIPGLGSGEAYDRLKGVNPQVKVLLSSGYSIDSEALGALARGCDGFIQKPFTLQQLLKKMRAILDKKDATDHGS